MNTGYPIQQNRENSTLQEEYYIDSYLKRGGGDGEAITGGPVEHPRVLGRHLYPRPRALDHSQVCHGQISNPNHYEI